MPAEPPSVAKIYRTVSGTRSDAERENDLSSPILITPMMFMEMNSA
jgi:hypothetical protein